MQLSDNGGQIGIKRYFQHEENWEGCSLRSAVASANVEAEPNKWIDPFHEIIYELKFLPAGRILRNSMLGKGSLLNCYHKPIGDSIEEIANFIRDSLILWSEGGGMGTTLSGLRPKGARIVGKGGESSGPISFLTATDAVARTVESGGSRRAAGLGGLFVGHPDIFQFINAKNEDGLIETFNLSVEINEDFLDAVTQDKEWNLTFNQKLYDTVRAKDLWDLIVHNMCQYSEPGILNLDNMRTNNSYYFAPISGVNPCGEATLSRDEACDLGSVVLPSFVSAGGYTNWKALKETIYLAVRFLDNILSANKYTLDNIKQAVFRSRRIGLGVIGLAEYMFAKKVRYGSQESIRLVDQLFKFIMCSAYEASIKLAQEKGTFPMFDIMPYSKAKFVRKLPAYLRKDIKQYGMRNVTVLAMPPTGTTSLLADSTSGIEPLPAKAYIREDRVGKREYIHPLFKQYYTEGDVPEWLVDSHDVLPEEHMEVQAAVQKYVDGAVSKTINLPNDYKDDKLSEIMLEYAYDLKGVTVYRDGSKFGQPIVRMTDTQIKKALNTASNDMVAEDVMCSTGSCEI